jgi:hypothetical protein
MAFLDVGPALLDGRLNAQENSPAGVAAISATFLPG